MQGNPLQVELEGKRPRPPAMTPVVGDRLNGATNRGCGQRRVRPLPLETAGQDTERLTVNFSAEQKDKTYTIEHLDFSTLTDQTHLPECLFCSFTPDLCDVGRA